MVNIFSSGRFKLNRKLVIKETEAFLQANNVAESDFINIIFVGRRKMISVAEKYKHEPVALPVLSFKYCENELLGEIFICYPQAVLLAAEREKTVDKTILELVFHGIDNILT